MSAFPWYVPSNSGMDDAIDILRTDLLEVVNDWVDKNDPPAPPGQPHGLGVGAKCRVPGGTSTATNGQVFLTVVGVLGYPSPEDPSIPLHVVQRFYVARDVSAPVF